MEDLTLVDSCIKESSDVSLKNSNLILSALQNSITLLFESERTSTDEVFNLLLQEVGQSINASRAYIFNAYKNENGDFLVNQTHEWVSRGIKPQINNPTTHHVRLQEIGLERWQQGFLNREVIQDVISELAEPERAIFEPQDIKVIVVAPIYVNNEWRRFVGLDECTSTRNWQPLEINALLVCAKTIGSALGFMELKNSKQHVDSEIHKVEQKIHDALESAEHGVWDWDLRTDKVYYSEILEKQLGYNGHEFTDALTEWRDRVHPDDLDATYKKVRDHLEGKTPIYRAEFRMRKKDGDYAWMLAIAKAIRDENGIPTRLPGTHTDISFQKELEEKVAKQQDLLHSLVKGFPDLVWLKDIEGIYLAANTRFEDFFGHSADDIIGHTDYDYVDKELADFFREHDKIAMAKGSQSRNEETITFANDGHQETLETIKIPIHYKDGELIGVLGVGRDITERIKSEEQIKLAASVFENAHEGILICNANVEIIDVNPIFESISGYSKTELIGQNPRIFSSGQQPPIFYKQLWTTLQKRGFWQGELLNRKKSGQIYPILSNISSIKNEKGDVTHYLSIFTDITQIKVNQQKLEHMAHYDALTGLPNRVLLAERLERAIVQCNRDKHNNNNPILAVCFIDLDNFKPVNDLLGHSAGDKLLKTIGTKLTRHLREADTLARIGGDEFVLLLSGQKNTHQIKILAQKVLSLIAQPISIDSHTFQLSASMGISIYPEDQADSDGLIRHADQAMYEAKLLGKNRIHFFDVAAAKAYKESNDMHNELKSAIQHDQFTLYFQPKVNLKNKTIIGFEALIRWNHPSNGLLAPNQFLSLIEDLHLSYQLDLWVLDQAIHHLNEWHKRGYNLIVSINISPNSLLTSSFVEALETIFVNNPHLPPALLEIEVLESTNFGEIEIARQHLLRIKQQGIRVALDDFGTGASSLSYLKNLPANVVKIDQSFILDILEDPSDLAIVKGIIQLADVFDLEVIAEGVESKEHAEILYALGCFFIQGYWIAKPIAPDAMEAFIHQWKIPSDFKYY